MLDGYLHGQGEDENKFCVDQTRWHRTGDAGYFDDRGRLWLLGRCAARVDDGHGALYPMGVEQAAMRNPSIGKAAMVSHHGQRVLAVTLRAPKTQPDFASLFKSFSFANVDSIRIVKRMPLDRRHQSKIDYSSLLSCWSDDRVSGQPKLAPRAEPDTPGAAVIRLHAYLSERFPLLANGLLIVSFYSSNQFLAHALSRPVNRCGTT